MYAISPLYTPRPWLPTILLFLCELAILMRARRTGSWRSLLWLPLLFAIWANVHIQFVYGLMVLALAVAEALLSRWRPEAQHNLSWPYLTGVFVASSLAVLVNPYGWRVYQIAVEFSKMSRAAARISEMQSLPFRDLPSYLVLFLALASVAVLSRERRLLSFEGALLTLVIVLSFRSQRDVWLIAVVAAVILAPALPRARTELEHATRAVSVLALAPALLLIGACAVIFGLTNARLQADVAKKFPVAAVQHIQAHGYSGPLFNDFNWGGYLIWSLRQPVTMDGRSPVYGDTLLERSIGTWNAGPDWANDPDLKAAKIVIGPVGAPLVQLLRRDPHYQLAYQDKLAVVFIPRQ